MHMKPTLLPHQIKSYAYLTMIRAAELITEPDKFNNDWLVSLRSDGTKTHLAFNGSYGEKIVKYSFLAAVRNGAMEVAGDNGHYDNEVFDLAFKTCAQIAHAAHGMSGMTIACKKHDTAIALMKEAIAELEHRKQKKKHKGKT